MVRTTPGLAGVGGLVATISSGSAIALTSANATPAGKVVGGGKLLNARLQPTTFGPLSVITFRTSVTPAAAFAEGQVMFGAEVTTQWREGPVAY
jgi:hypothetical protein